jgi:hypothetical protein
MNQTTYEMVQRSLTRHGRIPLIARKTRLWCASCQSMQSVADVFGKVTRLACGCRRPTVLRTDAEVTAYDEAVKERSKRKVVSGSNFSQGSVIVWVEEAA